jgi:hypothetical protein
VAFAQVEVDIEDFLQYEDGSEWVHFFLMDQLCELCQYLSYNEKVCVWVYLRGSHDVNVLGLQLLLLSSLGILVEQGRHVGLTH